MATWQHGTARSISGPGRRASSPCGRAPRLRGRHVHVHGGGRSTLVPCTTVRNATLSAQRGYVASVGDTQRGAEDREQTRTSARDRYIKLFLAYSPAVQLPEIEAPGPASASLSQPAAVRRATRVRTTEQAATVPTVPTVPVDHYSLPPTAFQQVVPVVTPSKMATFATELHTPVFSPTSRPGG